MTKKQFVGRSKTIETKFGKMHKVGISAEDYNKFNKNGWLNVIVKFSKEGNVYLELDEWQPKAEDKKVPYPDDIPF